MASPASYENNTMPLFLERSDLREEHKDIPCSATSFEHFKPEVREAICAMKGIGAEVRFLDRGGENYNAIYPPKELTLRDSGYQAVLKDEKTGKEYLAFPTLSTLEHEPKQKYDEMASHKWWAKRNTYVRTVKVNIKPV